MDTGKSLVGCMTACFLWMSDLAGAEMLDEIEGLDGTGVASVAELDGARGRENLRFDIDDFQLVTQQNDGQQTAQLENNLIEGSLTGNNWIGGEAMSGLHGIATVIQNTGNQVIIQDTTLVNVMMSP